MTEIRNITYTGELNDCQQLAEKALSRKDEVMDLPMEDSIWVINTSDNFKDEQGETAVYMSVQDHRHVDLGMCVYHPLRESLPSICRKVVCVTALYPSDQVPRRPRKVTFKDSYLAEEAVGLDLSDLGITFMYAGVGMDSSDLPTRIRACCVCGRRGTKDLFKNCLECKAMLYCSKMCQTKDWVQSGSMVNYSHKHWCKAMKRFVERAEELGSFCFTYTPESTSEDFDYRSFLKRMGVLDRGGWRMESQQKDSYPSFGELPETEDLIVLPVESVILDSAPDHSPPPLGDWHSYYGYRGFRLDSPVAILLQWPLTIHYILHHCLPHHDPQWREQPDSAAVLIDMIGVRMEVDLMPIFKELGYLNPDVKIDINMYGVEISKSKDGYHWQHQNVSMTVIRGLYHKRAVPTRKPHVVIGLNAGLGAYRQWQPTLEKLKMRKQPAYFTDYCQYSYECARMAVETSKIGTLSEPVINPFRSPARKLAEENDMPSYSNGFLFHLIYQCDI